MDLFTALRSKSARLTSWKDVYDVYVKCLPKKYHQITATSDKEADTLSDTVSDSTDWYALCMNDSLQKLLLPSIKKRSGATLTFEVKKINDTYFNDHVQNYLQMVVMATLYNVTCDSQQDIYVSHYDHDTELVVAYPIEKLLMASFYGVKMRGILFIKSLNQSVMSKGYKIGVLDSDARRAMIKNLDYEEMFGFPYDDDNDDDDNNESDEDSDDSDKRKYGKKSKLTRSAKVKTVKHADYDDDSNGSKGSGGSNNSKYAKTKPKPKTIDDLQYYPCCSYRVNITGKVVEKCTDATADGAHHCFGCDTDFKKNVTRNNVPIHSQMFDFNKFVTSIKRENENEYTIEFDENQNASYKHASYTDMGRADVLTNVKETVSKLSWVTSMKIKITPKNDVYVLNVQHVGIDWF